MRDIINKEINRQLRRLLALTVMGSLSLATIFAVGSFSKTVSIHDGDNVISLVTMNTDLVKIVEQADLELGPDDLIFKVDQPDGSTEIVIKRAFDVSVSADEQTIPLRFVMGTVSDAINSSGVVVGENDLVTPELHTDLESNMSITIQRRNKILISADGRIKEYCVPIGVTIGEAIRLLEIPLYEDDIVDKDMSEMVVNDMQISIERVGYRNKITTKPVPYKTVRKNADYLDEGKTVVSVKGANGESEIVIKETLKDGEVVNSEEVKNKVTVQPVDEVILIGTKKKNQTVQVSPTTPDKAAPSTGSVGSDNVGTIKDHKGNTLSYSKVLTGSGTAYTADPGAITSTGTVAKYGTVAVNPNIIPYGTKLYIVSTDGFVYGYATACDTGGALRQGTALVDLYMNSTQECYNFGRRTVKVYILN